MNSLEIQYFLTIVKYGSFTEAAQALSVSQPAISKRDKPGLLQSGKVRGRSGQTDWKNRKKTENLPSGLHIRKMWIRLISVIKSRMPLLP